MLPGSSAGSACVWARMRPSAAPGATPSATHARASTAMGARSSGVRAEWKRVTGTGSPASESRGPLVANAPHRNRHV